MGCSYIISPLLLLLLFFIDDNNCCIFALESDKGKERSGVTD